MPLPVHAPGAVPVVVPGGGPGRHPVHEHGAEGGALPELAAEAHHRVVVGGDDVGDFPGLHVQQAQVVVPGLAREAGAAEDGDRHAARADADPPAEEEVHRTAPAHGEVPGVLQEEGALLREEQVESGEVDLLVVHLHLGEVGVVGQIEVQAGGDADLGVQAEVVLLLRFRLDRVVPTPGAEGEGDEFQVARRGQLQAVEFPGGGEAVEVVDAGHRRPVVLFALAPDVALEVDPPGLRAVAVAQRPQRDRELGGPAVVADRGSDGPGSVPVQVEPAPGAGARPHLRPPAASASAAPGVADLAVVLEARRGGAEDEPVLQVVVGVEDDLEGVRVAEPRVPAGVGGDDAVGVAVVEGGADVERVVVEEDADLGALRRRLPLEGVRLDEPGQRLRPLPDLVVQAPVYERRFHGRRGPPDAGAGLALLRPCRRGGEGGGEQEGGGEGRTRHSR